MNSPLAYAPLEGGDRSPDLPAVGRILAHAFAGGTPDQCVEWLAKAGLDQVRLVRDGTRTIACLIRIPMGQFWGGRSVPLVGIAGVGVAPEARGRGVAGFLMRHAVAEIAREGVPLSGLYPATQPLYRRVGYEQGGHRFEVRIPARLVNFSDRESPLRMRAMDESDRPAVRDLYRRAAPVFNGHMDRGEYLWGRVFSPRIGTGHGFLVEGDAGVEGYCVIVQKMLDHTLHRRQEVQLSDAMAASPAAARRLLAFLSEFTSMGEEIVFFGGPTHPFLAMLPEQSYTCRLHMHWMTRIIEVKGALEARGYSPHVAAGFTLDVTDETLPGNTGSYDVRVADGRASVTRRPARAGAPGAGVALDCRALASLYCGFLSAEQLSLTGALRGPAEQVAAASAAFAGPTPWMGEMY